MAGTEEFVCTIWRRQVVREAERASREAWETYCSRERMNVNAGAGVPTLSRFLIEHGVENLFLFPGIDHLASISYKAEYAWLFYPVIRGKFGESRWGREDMFLSSSGLDREECLLAMANFGGGIYLRGAAFTVTEAVAFFKALSDSSTNSGPHTLSIHGDFAPSNKQEDDSFSAEHIMIALRHNSRIRNLALYGIYAYRFNNISLMDGISLDRLYLGHVYVSDEFLKALPSTTYSTSVTHSLTLNSLIRNQDSSWDWKSSFSTFLHWQLKHLSLVDFKDLGPQELINFMATLSECTDTSLHSLSLGSLLPSQDIQGTPEYSALIGAIVDALHRSTLPSLHIYHWGHCNRLSSPAIDAQLLKNQQILSNSGFARLQAEHKVPAAAVRMFICGDPYAGKTTLLSTLSSVCASMPLIDKVKACFLPRLCVVHQIERTRGIQIHHITKGGIQLSLWDLAGQREFHAFHDLMFPDPSGDSGSPTIFMFVWSPVESEDERRGKTKSEEDFRTSFFYWLKFIASKTRQSNILRKLIVVITRKDQIDLLEDALTTSIEDVASKFKQIVEVVEVLIVDARDPLCIKSLASCIFGTAGAVLKGVEIYGMCNKVSKYLSSQQAQESLIREKPIISWDDFSDLCKTKFQVTDPKVQKAIACTLNNSGDIIYFGNLPYIVLAPNWFCHEVMGSLISFADLNVSKDFIPIHGYARQSYLEKVLKRSTHSRVEGCVLVNIMEAMHLCFRVSGDKIFIPATLLKSSTASSRQWKMIRVDDKLEAQQYTYLGRRLECDRKDVTFLTPGLFPTIQVVFGKAFSGEEADLEMAENFMSICMLDMEIVVEFGRSRLGHIIDVMVRASADKLKSGGRTLAYVEEEIVKTLIRVCAQPVGNQGVTLVESIIRPDCLHGPSPLQVRDDQCVLVLDLKQKLRKQLEAGESRCLQYLWKSSPNVQPIAHSFLDLLGFEVYMQVLVSYKESLRDASVSLLPSTSDKLPHADIGGRQMEEKVDVESSSSLEGDDIHLAVIKESNLLKQLHAHGGVSTDDNMRAVDSICQLQEMIKDSEDVKDSTDESQEQIVDAMGKGMVRAIYREVRSMNARLKGMDARQKEMERKVDNVLDSIETMRSDLLPRIRAVAEQCFNFAVESEVGRTPRFVFLTDMDVVRGAGKRRRVMASLFKELKRVHVELFCEHKRRPHRVEGQEGVCVTLVDDKEVFVVKALPYVKGFLKVLTLVTKVGAHVVAGAGSMVPDFSQLVALVLDTPHVLDSQSSLLTSTPVSVDSMGGWQEWLESVLEKQGGSTNSNIYNKFKLRRVRFQDTSRVAWLCDEHYHKCEMENFHSHY